ncbi:hypothetical protein ABIE78_006223 [Sinorhizobium fredii]|jgi:hypothetical protein
MAAKTERQHVKQTAIGQILGDDFLRQKGDV